MRILHSSDWHLGQHFIGKSRAPEHQAFFRWLKAQIEQHDVDVLIVAGDIFDTSTPPSYARELYHQLIVDLLPTQCQLVLLGGNHDSVAVLQESQSLLEKLSAQVVPGWLGEASQHLVTLKNKQGSTCAHLLALPFLRSRDLLQSKGGENAAQKQQQLQQAIAQSYHDLYQAALLQQKELGVELPILATGHLTTVGASTSDSVREIYIGTLEAFPASAFPPVDYLALGHIHQAQKVASKEHWRYSGSPLALSFDESRQQKSVVLIEFEAAPVQQVQEARVVFAPKIELLPVPCFQVMLSLQCELAQLEDLLAPAIAKLAPGQVIWLELQLQGADALLVELNQLVEHALKGKPVELLKLRRASAVAKKGLEIPACLSLTELEPETVLEQRFAQEDLTQEQRETFKQMAAELLAKLQGEQT